MVERPDPEQLLAHDVFLRGLARSLTRDAHAAEDLAQQTWLAALERPPAARSALRAWLAAVVRRIAGKQARGMRRETARERRAAREERVPAAAEIVAREAMRAEVVRAVLELDPLYRDVVLLRWFEELPPRAIARRREVPVETVRTRLKRALEILRARLDRQAGGRREAWSALLLPYAGKNGSPSVVTSAGARLLAGVLLMSTKNTFAVGAAMLCSLVLLAVWTWPTAAEGSTEPPAPGAATATTVAASSTGPIHPVAAMPSVGRQAVLAEPPLATGSLRIRAIWADDRRPAPGIVFQVDRFRDDPMFDHPRVVTRADGEVLVPDLEPGPLSVELLRGDASSPVRVRDEVIAERETVIEIAVPMGMTVRGKVVDGTGQPVPDSEVLVAPWVGGEALPLARTDSTGSFALRAVGTHCHVGARAAGYAPTELRQFTGSRGATVDLTLTLDQRGAMLVGTVFDPSGRPVAGAVVRLGVERHEVLSVDLGHAKPPMPAYTRTDAQGGFAFYSVPPGTSVLAARARGLAPWQATIDAAAGASSVVEVHLQAGAVLSGNVRAADGKPVDKAIVSVGDWTQLGYRKTESRRDGSFRLEGLPTGELMARAGRFDANLLVATLRAAPGQTVHWDPVLSFGRTWRARVLDANGKPVADAIADVQARHDRQVGQSNYLTDSEGRFTLRNVTPDAPLRIAVRRKGAFPELVLEEQIPGPEELVIRMPRESWIHIRGRVVDPEGEPVENVRLAPSNSDGSGSPAETNQAGTGAFDLGPYPPGEYSLQLQAEGYPGVRIPARIVAPDEVWDLGTIRLQRGGELAVDLIPQEGTAIADATLLLWDSAGDHAEQLDVCHGTARVATLAAGDHVLQITGRGIACQRQPIHIRSGIITHLDLALRRGVDGIVILALPPDCRSRVQTVIIRDAGGADVLHASRRSHDRRIPVQSCFLPGTYRVIATTDDGAHGEGELVVAAPGPSLATVTLAK